MSVQIRGLAAPVRANRITARAVTLAVSVTVAAALLGPAHFAGPRWVPALRIGAHAPSHMVSAPTHRPLHGRSGSGGLGEVLLWAGVGVVVLILVALAYRRWAERRRRDTNGRPVVVSTSMSPASAAPVAQPDEPVLRTGVEHALAVLDQQREPADAIVRAWLGLQESAQDAGLVRRPAETPTEFTSRILGQAFGEARPVRTLLRLYLRARFDDHPVTAENVETARAALQELVKRRPAPSSPAAAAGS